MIARFFVGEVGALYIDVVVGGTGAKLVADARVKERVAGRRSFERRDAVLRFHALAFDARVPFLALVIQRRAVTHRSDARQRLAGAEVSRVNVIGLEPEEEIVWVLLRLGVFIFRNDVPDRLGILRLLGLSLRER